MSNALENMEGQTFEFYGVDNTRFKLNEIVYQALEDEDDGYRSHLGSVEVVQSSKDVFYRSPLAKVRVEKAPDRENYEQEMWRLVDVKDGHTWLVIGTENTDDYYPWFVFDYSPKAKG